MNNRPFIEMNLLTSAKETENKLRWDAEVNGVTFSLYIPKWRVPNPWPAKSGVALSVRRVECDDLPNLAARDVKADSTLTLEPIVATIEWVSDKTNTAHYRPIGDKKRWEIGEPYIPFVLLSEKAARLRILVLWDISSRGAGFSQGRFQLLAKSG